MDAAFILLALKILLTLFVIYLVPVYWKAYGPQNFLWLSDVGMFMTLPALWLNSSLIFSMAAVGILPMEIIWMIDYFYRLLSGRPLLGITEYMFDRQYSMLLRSLSYFHFFIPAIWIVYLFRLGYNPHAFACQTAALWIILTLTRLLTDPGRNTNWVFLPEARGWTSVSPVTWMLILFIAYPLIVMLPLHYLLKMAFSL